MTRCVTKAPARGTHSAAQGVLASVRPSLQKVLSRVQRAITAWVPAGYEDESGFHYGEWPGMSERKSH